MIGEVVGGRSKREGIYVYVWLIHFLVKQKHNIIKQLYSTKIKLKNYCKHTKKKKKKPVWSLHSKAYYIHVCLNRKN